MIVEHLYFSYGKHKILKDLSLEFKKGRITTILGSNGSGKSTLFKLCTKELLPQKGKIHLDGQNINLIGRKAFARKVSIVHQHNQAAEDITVRELVSYGRTAHLGFMQGLTQEDKAEIDKAIQMCGLEKAAEKKTGHLSGGQLQRTWLAMAIANQPEVLFLDEPTTFLDIKYQFELLKLIRSLNQNLGMTIAMILHDINQAIEISHELIGLYQGELFFQGKAEEVISSETLSRLYDTELIVEKRANRSFVLAKEW